MTGASESRKMNKLLKLIKEQDTRNLTEKIYLYLFLSLYTEKSTDYFLFEFIVHFTNKLFIDMIKKIIESFYLHKRLLFQFDKLNCFCL